MTDTPQTVALARELKVVARKGVADFAVDDVPTLCAIVDRVKVGHRKSTASDIRRVIQDTVFTVTDSDHHSRTLAYWLFAIPNETRKWDLTGRRAQVSQLIGRSVSSIRQTDQPQLIMKLAEWLVTVPYGGLPLPAPRPLTFAVDMSSMMYKNLTTHLAVALNPYDYRRSRCEIINENQAVTRTSLYVEVASLPVSGWHHGVTQRSGDGRMQLLPVGHPYRPYEEDLAYRIDPPYEPGERFRSRIRHRYLFHDCDDDEGERSYPNNDPNVLLREASNGFDTQESLTLSLTVPGHRRYCPTWFEYDSDRRRELRDGPMPRTFAGDRYQQFTVVISEPPTVSTFGILLDESELD